MGVTGPFWLWRKSVSNPMEFDDPSDSDSDWVDTEDGSADEGN
jgi:hypothetical protein